MIKLKAINSVMYPDFEGEERMIDYDINLEDSRSVSFTCKEVGVFVYSKGDHDHPDMTDFVKSSFSIDEILCFNEDGDKVRPVNVTDEFLISLVKDYYEITDFQLQNINLKLKQ
jgi:hypothetical protein